MIFDYKELEKKGIVKNYDPILKDVLVGVGNEYDRMVTRSNKEIFTGELTVGDVIIKYPKNFKERLKAQNRAIAAKLKLINRYSELFTENEITRAITTYKP